RSAFTNRNQRQARPAAALSSQQTKPKDKGPISTVHQSAQTARLAPTFVAIKSRSNDESHQVDHDALTSARVQRRSGKLRYPKDAEPGNSRRDLSTGRAFRLSCA